MKGLVGYGTFSGEVVVPREVEVVGCEVTAVVTCSIVVNGAKTI